MTEREKKMVAFLAGIIYDLARGLPITDDEIRQVDNIAGEFGFFDLDEKEFMY